MTNDFKRFTEKDKDVVWEDINTAMISLMISLVDYGEPFAHATFATMIQTYCEKAEIDPFAYCLELGNAIVEVKKRLENGTV